MITERHRDFVLAVDAKYETKSFLWYGFALRAGWDLREVPQLIPELVRYEYMACAYGGNGKRLKPSDSIFLTQEGHLAAQQWRQQIGLGFVTHADPVVLAQENARLRSESRRLAAELRVLAAEDARLFAENQTLRAEGQRLRARRALTGETLLCPRCAHTSVARASFCARCGMRHDVNHGGRGTAVNDVVVERRATHAIRSGE
jgi:hypothetical protein